jgi:hypothetical protein
MSDEPEIDTITIAETANYMVWKAEEPDGEVTYHLELGMTSLHFFNEEWEELLELIRSIT